MGGVTIKSTYSPVFIHSQNTTSRRKLQVVGGCPTHTCLLSNQQHQGALPSAFTASSLVNIVSQPPSSLLFSYPSTFPFLSSFHPSFFPPLLYTVTLWCLFFRTRPNTVLSSSNKPVVRVRPVQTPVSKTATNPVTYQPTGPLRFPLESLIRAGVQLAPQVAVAPATNLLPTASLNLLPTGVPTQVASNGSGIPTINVEDLVSPTSSTQDSSAKAVSQIATAIPYPQSVYSVLLNQAVSQGVLAPALQNVQGQLPLTMPTNPHLPVSISPQLAGSTADPNTQLLEAFLRQSALQQQQLMHPGGALVQGVAQEAAKSPSPDKKWYFIVGFSKLIQSIGKKYSTGSWSTCEHHWPSCLFHVYLHGSSFSSSIQIWLFYLSWPFIVSCSGAPAPRCWAPHKLMGGPTSRGWGFRAAAQETRPFRVVTWLCFRHLSRGPIYYLKGSMQQKREYRFHLAIVEVALLHGPLYFMSTWRIFLMTSHSILSGSWLLMAMNMCLLAAHAQ